MPFFSSKSEQQAIKKEKEKVMNMLEEISIYQAQIETTFEDIGGLDDGKKVMSEIIDFFKNEQKYKDIGAKLPKGVLISGPPGTGKTLLARSVAGETGLPIIYVPGSRFVDVYAGMGAEKVRSLFSVAKANAPCIVFIDEIDTVGKKPGTVSNASNDEREQTLNQLLSEMDGFETSSGILVIAATNRPDMLSPALLREGRFDRHIYINKPELLERKAIFELYINKIKAEEDIDTEELAYQSAGMTGAEIAGIVNEAAIKAVKAGKDTVEETDLFAALEQKSIGFKHSNIFLNDHEKGIASIHEAARVVALIGLAPNCSIQSVSILPSTDRLAGNTLKYQTKNAYIKTRTELLSEIQILLAGYCAELLYTGDVSTACANDIKEATEKAVSFVCEYGLSDSIGPVAFGVDKMLESQQAEIFAIMDTCKKSMLKYVEDNKNVVVSIAKALNESESLSRTDLYEIISHEPIVKASKDKETNLLSEISSAVKSAGNTDAVSSTGNSSISKKDCESNAKQKPSSKTEKSPVSKKKNESPEETIVGNSADKTDNKNEKKPETKSSASFKPDEHPPTDKSTYDGDLTIEIPDEDEDTGSEVKESDYADTDDIMPPGEYLEEFNPIPDPPKKESDGKKNGSRKKKRSDAVTDMMNSILSK